MGLMETIDQKRTDGDQLEISIDMLQSWIHRNSFFAKKYILGK